MKRKIWKILLVLLILTGYFVIETIVGFFLEPYFFKNEFTRFLIRYSVMIPILIGTCLLLRKKDILRFSWKSFWTGLTAGGVFLVGGLIIMALLLCESIMNQYKPMPFLDIVIFILAILVGTGLTEELLFRGVIQGLFEDFFGRKTRKNLFATVIVTAVLFGSAHLTNFFAVEAAYFPLILAQAVTAFSSGLCFGAIRLRSGNIWPVAFIHGFWDLSTMVEQGIFGVGTVLGELGNKGLENIQNEEMMQKVLQYKLYVAIVVCVVVVSIDLIMFFFLMRKKKTEPLLEYDRR